MGYLPIFLEVSGRCCVVIGGGEIAERKTCSLLEAEADIIVVSPTLSAGLAALAARGAIRHIARAYQTGDIDGAFLAFEASGDPGVVRAAAAEAHAAGVLINVADVPELCSFIAPAVVKRGALQIAISTGGASPALARNIREELEDRFGAEFESMLEVLAAARRWLQVREADPAARTGILTALVTSDLLEALKHGDSAAADATVRRILGASLADLGFDPSPLTATPSPSSGSDRPAGAAR
jgi:precorrin-2 dehydrogenase/sirohydrochlorin ferrochelatase